MKLFNTLEVAFEGNMDGIPFILDFSLRQMQRACKNSTEMAIRTAIRYNINRKKVPAQKNADMHYMNGSRSELRNDL